jgi:hypothetical protein
MYVDNAPETSFELSVSTIERTGIFSHSVLRLPNAPKVLSAQTLIMIIFIQIGIILALIGWMFKSPLVILIGGVVILLAIALAPLMTRLFMYLWGG